MADPPLPSVPPARPIGVTHRPALGSFLPRPSWVTEGMEGY